MTKYERHAQSQRKHGPRSVSSASKAPAPPPVNRPGWTGPSYIKKVQKQTRPASEGQPSAASIQSHHTSFEAQQQLLEIFRVAFPASHDFEALKPLLQQINDAVLEKDYQSALQSQECLEAYAIRWSPSRALAYANLLAEICEDVPDDPWVQLLTRDQDTAAKVVCFGGGPADVAGLASMLSHVVQDTAGKPAVELEVSEESEPKRQNSVVKLGLVDAVDWSSVVARLHAGLTTPPVLSKYASASARASNASFLRPGAMTLQHHTRDILGLSAQDLGNMIGVAPALCTIFFTLNDLFTSSVPKTTAFLLKLTSVVPQGTLLLVVDQVDATCAVGSNTNAEEKRELPMSWLLNRALMPAVPSADGPAWEKVIDDPKRLYRHPERELRYPLSLENLRLQVHLYRRLV